MRPSLLPGDDEPPTLSRGAFDEAVISLKDLESRLPDLALDEFGSDPVRMTMLFARDAGRQAPIQDDQASAATRALKVRSTMASGLANSW